MAQRFEDLDVWQRGCRLSIQLFQELNHCSNFPYRDQVTRAGLSIPSNIAEGYERDSSPEFIRFLTFAKASAGELRTQLYIGAEAGLIERELGLKLIEETVTITKMIAGLIKYRKNR